MKKVLNKWQVVLYFKNDYNFYFPNLYIFSFGFLKLKSFPKEGTMLSNNNYNGFIFSFNVLLPITIRD